MAQLEERLRIVEDWRRKSQEYSSQIDDPLVTLFSRTFETVSAIASHPADNDARIDRAIISLDSDRKIALQFETEDFNVIRHLSFGLIESLQVLLEVKRKNMEEQNLPLVDEDPNTSLVLKEEPFDPMDLILNGQQLFEDDNSTLDQIERPLNKPSSNDKDSNENIAPSDEMGDNVNSMEDPCTSLDELEPAMKRLTDKIKTEKKVDNLTTTPSRPVKHAKSHDESELLVKKPRINTEKTIDNEGDDHLQLKKILVAPIASCSSVHWKEMIKPEAIEKELARKEKEQREKAREQRRSVRGVKEVAAVSSNRTQSE